MENLKKSTLKGTDRDLQLVHCLMLTGKRLQSFKKILGGGFIFFHPYLGKISVLTSIFFRWVGSTTNQNEVTTCIS